MNNPAACVCCMFAKDLTLLEFRKVEVDLDAERQSQYLI